jgi:hypothetical protein
MFPLTVKEKEIASKIDNYFRSSSMSLKEKVFQARLIALYDLEAHQFCSEDERLRIIEFKKILDGLLQKIN